MYEIFLVNFWVIKTHNFVSGLRTLKPKKPLKPLKPEKPEKPKNLKTFFLKKPRFFSPDKHSGEMRSRRLQWQLRLSPVLKRYRSRLCKILPYVANK